MSIDSDKRKRIKYQYGISLEYLESIKKFQGYRCAICRIPESKLGKGLVIDHDHKTGEVRGLLCAQCNSGLGLFKESIKRLIRACIYINKKHNLTSLINYANNILNTSEKDVLNVVGTARVTYSYDKNNEEPTA